ncbi:hypothetical protein [Devosia sp.]|uniref:hypothetical protein n=1 Tax=Devosia sp. TaxID=1871048 RepID=UPI003267F82C
MLKSMEWAAPMLAFALHGVEITISANRQDSPPKLIDVVCEIIVETEENDHRLALLHTNVRKYGTISNTIAAATTLTGTMRRRS